MHFFRVRQVFLVLGLVFVLVPVAAVEAEGAGVGPGDNFQGSPPLVRTLVLKWGRFTDGPVHSTPVPSGNLVLVGSDGGVLYARDLQTGHHRWDFPALAKIRTTLLVHGNRVFFGAFNGFVYALELTTGWLDWQFITSGQITSPVRVVGDTVLVGSNDGMLYALQADTGALRWQFSTGDDFIRAPIATAGSMVYIATERGILYAVDTDQVEVRWRRKNPGLGGAWLLPWQDRLFVLSRAGDGEGTLVLCLDRFTSDIMWSQRFSGGFSWSRPLVERGRLYVTLGPRLLALHTLTGRVLWEISVRHVNWGYKSTTVSFGAPELGPWGLYVPVHKRDRDLERGGGQGNEIWIIDPETGKIRWRVPIPGPVSSGLAVLERILLFGSSSLRVYALGSIAVEVNQRMVAFSVLPPFLKERRTNVPVREVAEAMGWAVKWKPQTKEIKLERNERTVAFSVDSPVVLVNGEMVEVEKQVELVAGRAVLPVRPLVGLLGGRVDWDPETLTVKIWN